MRSDVFVVSTAVADGERFAILRGDKMPVGPSPWSSSPEDWRRSFDRYLRAVALLREEDVRAQLADMGLSSDEAGDQIERARNLNALNEQTIWERTTRIGYRNNHRQEVIQKTRLAGSLPDQRIYVLRCGDCGHEYGANGCEVHSRRCPHCHGGSSGLPISDIES